MPQKKKIALSDNIKNKLTSLKKSEDQTYDEVVHDLIYSSIQNSPSTGTVAGVGSGEGAFQTYTHVMGWIADTMKKMPAGGNYDVTPEMRERTYEIEPLVNGIIYPFLSNVLYGDYNLVTADNKKYGAMIKDIKKFIKIIKLIQILKEDFQDYGIKHGHSYRRKDYFLENNTLEKLQRLETKAMRTYEDPHHSNIIAYHQGIFANDKWNSTAETAMTETNSWWIPGGLKIIESEQIEETGAREVWDQCRTKYQIDEVKNLRVGDSADIIAMHKVRLGKPAPIDAAIQAIWEKRTLIANIPNVIYAVIYPFIQNKKGVIVETTDQAGNKILITSVPQQPPAGMEATDPEKYVAMNAAYSAYTKAMKDDADNIMKYRAEGGVLVTGPDTDIKVIESASSIATGFIDTAIRNFDNDIGMALGFPTAMILARGAELATSDTIRKLFNTVYSGTQQEANAIANALIEERFSGQVWNYIITTKDGTEETSTFTLEETECEFKLSSGDVKDNLQIAQTELATLQGLQIAKTLGASKADIQALADERGFGLLDLEKFDQAPQAAPGGEIMSMDHIWGQAPGIQSAELIQSFNENHDEAGLFTTTDGSTGGGLWKSDAQREWHSKNRQAGYINAKGEVTPKGKKAGIKPWENNMNQTKDWKDKFDAGTTMTTEPADMQQAAGTRRAETIALNTITKEASYGTVNNQIADQVNTHISDRLKTVGHQFEDGKLNKIEFKELAANTAAEMDAGTSNLYINSNIDFDKNWESSKKYETETGTAWTVGAHYPREAQLKVTIDHEMGHMIQDKLSTKDKRAFTNVMEDAYNSRWRPISEYAMKSNEESFAETYAVYINGNKEGYRGTKLLTDGMIKFFDNIIRSK